MIIYMDDSPKTAIPFLANDYSSSLLCSCIYEPLFINMENEFLENLIVDLSDGKNVKLLFKKFYWSDGTRVTPHDLKKTLFYIIENKLDKAWYLDFIKGVTDYLEGVTTDLNNIKIFSDDTYLYIENLMVTDQYKFILSTIYFSPIRFVDGQPSTEYSYGAFKLEKFFHELKPNRYYANPLNEKLNILVNMDPQENIKQFLEGNCDLTSTTVFKKSDINFLHAIGEKVKIKTSKLQLQLEVSNNYISKKQYIFNSIRDIINNDANLLCDIKLNDFKEEGNFSKIKEEESFALLYSDYYPNNKISKKLLSKYNTKNLYIDYGDLNYFIEKYHSRKEYNIYLNVFSPVSQSTFDQYMTHLNFIIPEKEEEYIKYLNMWIKKEITSEKMDKFLYYYSKRIIIGCLMHYYLQSEKLNGLFIDGNDNFIFKEIRG